MPRPEQGKPPVQPRLSDKVAIEALTRTYPPDWWIGCWPRPASTAQRRLAAVVPPPIPDAACRDIPNVRATPAWVAPWANMRAASRRRCSKPAESRRLEPVLMGIAATFRVRCPDVHMQHASPNYTYQPIPRTSLNE